jgi:hypothetical protein
MSDFKVVKPDIAGLVTTGDEITLTFEWFC